jgi:hypothetical protein
MVLISMLIAIDWLIINMVQLTILIYKYKLWLFHQERQLSNNYLHNKRVARSKIKKEKLTAINKDFIIKINWQKEKQYKLRWK